MARHIGSFNPRVVPRGRGDPVAENMPLCVCVCAPVLHGLCQMFLIQILGQNANPLRGRWLCTNCEVKREG